MRLTEFHIDGFGRLSAMSFTDVPPGLSVVVGDNEEGKTTLLEFLRSILFGLPTRKQKEFYPPLRGGRKGGRVVLLDRQSQRIIVERFEGKQKGLLAVTFSDGSMGGEEEFRQLIGSATDDLYRNIFAFSLSELQTFESLNTEKVRDAIYSAGIGIGRRTISDVVQELKKQSGELFVPGGSKKAMNQILNRLENLARQIKDHKKDFDEYERFQSELETCESNINQIGLDLSEARRRLERLRILHQAWNDWIALGACRETLRTLPQTDSFPQDGVQRLDVLSAELRGFRDQIKQTDAEHLEAETDLSAIEVDKSLLSAAEDIRGLERGLQLFEKTQQAHPACQTDLQRSENNLDGMVRDLGEQWDEDKLRKFDLSVPVKDEIRRCQQAFTEAKNSTREREVQLGQETRQLDESIAFEQEAESHLKQLPQPLDTFDIEGVRQLILGRQSYESARKDLPVVEKQFQTRVGYLFDTLRKIGPDWTEDRLKKFDTSLTIQEEVSSHQKALADFGLEQQNATRHAADAVQAFNAARADLARAESVLVAIPVPEVKDQAELSERRRLVRSLRARISDVDQSKARLIHLDERRQDLDVQAERLKKDVGQEAFGFPGWVITAILASGCAGLLALGLWRADWLSGTIILGLSILVAILLVLARRTSATTTESKRADRTRQIGDLECRSLTLEKETEEIRRKVKQSDSDAHGLAQSAGLQGALNTQAVDEAEAAIERDLEIIGHWRPAEQQRRDAEAILTNAEKLLARCRQVETEKTDILAKARHEWRQWLTKAGLPESLAPETATNVLARLDAAREQLKAIEGDRERIGQMKTAIQDYEHDVKSVITRSGIEDGFSDEAGPAMDTLMLRLTEHEQRVRALADASRSLEEAKKQKARDMNKFRRATQLHEDALTAERHIDQQWKDLLARLGLASSLAVESAPQMLLDIDRARDQWRHVEGLREQVRTSQHSMDGYCQAVRSLAIVSGRTPPADADVSRAVSFLARDLNQAEDDHRRAEALKAQIKQLKSGAEQLQTQIDQRQQEINRLFEAARTADEEAFRRAASDHELQRKTNERIHQLEMRLQQLAGSGDAFNTLTENLSRTTPEALNSENTELEEATKELDQQRTEAADKRGRLKQQLDQLESSEELSRLHIDEQAGLAEFASSAEEWSVLRIATQLIERARAKYERERRPAVLKEAERYFTRFTKGNYTEIHAPVGADQLNVLARDGSAKEAGQLSRGTAEQLYLSLRFGFVHEFVGRSEPLPLVFDDILVNFDPGRARATAEAIFDLSKSLQILFFTCHPSTVELMREVDCSIPVFSLKDGRFNAV